MLAQVAERAAGVPLFIEETLKMVLEGEPAGATTIPGTLRNPLAARLDALGDSKEIAQVASVAALGGEFGLELLQAVTDQDEADVREALDELMRAELLYERGGSDVPVYVFKHALIRDAAYRSLLRSARRDVHGRIADVLVERFPTQVEHEPELIAQHLAEAGRTLRGHRPLAAGRRARIACWATEEAASHFAEGLALLPSLTDHAQTRELEARPARRSRRADGDSRVCLTGSRGCVRRAEVLSREFADPSRLAPALYGLGAYYAASAQPRKACEFGRRLVEVAELQGDQGMFIEAHVILAIAEYLRKSARSSDERRAGSRPLGAGEVSGPHLRVRAEPESSQ